MGPVLITENDRMIPLTPIFNQMSKESRKTNMVVMFSKTDNRIKFIHTNKK